MSHCPYCGGKLTGKIAVPRMSARQRRIYDAIINAGQNGISQADLASAMYNGGKVGRGFAVMLRVKVHEINKIIQGLHAPLQTRGGIYRLADKK